ncbi:FAD-dependent oxidoreductase [Sphingomonas sp. BIUV-7]|uniref:FAD-dependent oxidoreductase n=1 Tax=Sphingomonas natans TaxID=3063330 RepID=A0ABT8Y815_9SPHN|nr:FAD-dependent oxidoreductase [Sphingomonas sp. BIUV-7]MDO6414471.1 FAD-dependent oxidoreductase [Sphingomonas sp. BIUV-7]
MTDPLMQPFQTKNLTFKNRIVHAPTTLNMSDERGYATRQAVGAYEALAAGGYGAVCVGATCVRWDGLINERMLGFYDDTYTISHREIVEVIHNNGALAGIQLFYGGLIPGVGATFPIEPGKGWIPGTVSWGPSGKYPIGNPEPGVVPTEEYEDIVECFGQAARRAKEAGYDYVSYHFCHGSLPHVTLSLLENQGRNDKYQDRFLFCEEIVLRAQELCGKDYPQIPRLVCDENFEGGYDVDYFIEHYATRLHDLGIDALDCTFGSMLPAKNRDPEVSSGEVIGGGFYVPNMVALPYIKHLREGLQARGIDMPLMGSCNVNTPDQMRAMIADGAADFYASCRQSLDDPDFPRKIAEGRENEIRKSTRTGASLMTGNIFAKGIAGSAQNATFGRNRDYALTKTLDPKKVAIVGGGSGGMEYAITAHQIGHDVTIYEAGDQLGGVMAWAGNYKNLPNMEQIAYQPDWHKLMVAKHGISVKLNQTVTADFLKGEKPDVVVIATGAKPALPVIEGLDEALASGAAMPIDDVLSGKTSLDKAQPVLIWGSGEGIELALDLVRSGYQVRLIDPAPAFVPAAYIGSRARPVLRWAGQDGLAVEQGVTLVRVTDKAATLRNADGREETASFGALVVAPGRVAYDPLSRDLLGSGLRVQVVGDARIPRSYGNAIHEAAYLARHI